MQSSVIEFFAVGGPFMVPIACVFALGVLIALERWVYLTVTAARSRTLWAEVVPLLQRGDLRGVAERCQASSSAIATVLGYGLARVANARRRDDVDLATHEGMMTVRPRLERRTHYLATLANIATLLGLLGTIMGLISAFTAVAGANAADKADLLSGSISVAMNTTAFGLLVAIPLLIGHALLRMKTTELTDSLQMASVKFLNTVVEQRGEVLAP
ncbi:MAG TPA: MotA/TolQ/ExbB proton channel family protein [Steroidobacteraceae bacterium]|nr:MotA/TolQ/ExbB proton channel family protein [Steroidobacteraceae bacterium]